MNKNLITKPIVSVTLENGDITVFDKPVSFNFTSDIVFDSDKIKGMSLRDIDNKEVIHISKM
jgi:hypothetical protein